MRESPESDIASLLQLAFGCAVPTTAIPLPAGQGERLRAFALHDPDLPGRVLLRRYPPEEQARAFRAFTVMRALGALGFPAPAVYALAWSHHTGAIHLLVEYVEGRSDEGQPHAFFARVGAHFAQTLARLHRLPWDTLPDLAVLPLRFAFDDLAAEVRALGAPDILPILGWLAARVDQIDELPHTVLHGDYMLHNVLAEGTRIVAVQNWENALLADPRFDLGYASAALGAYGIVLSDQFVDAYESAAGPVPDRVFWEVFGALRLLARIGGGLAALSPAERDDAEERAWPVWEGLLAFVTERVGPDL
jgi:aminoglycoside phosphotransferase (APT) family kinase protein